MFASRLNKQIDRFVSWRPDPDAVAVNGFSLNWSEYALIYAFVPFRGGGGNDTFGPSMGNSKLVPHADGNASGQSQDISSQERYAIYTRDTESSSIVKYTKHDGMSYIRESFQSRNISPETTDILSPHGIVETFYTKTVFHIYEQMGSVLQ